MFCQRFVEITFQSDKVSSTQKFLVIVCGGGQPLFLKERRSSPPLSEKRSAAPASQRKKKRAPAPFDILMYRLINVRFYY